MVRQPAVSTALTILALLWQAGLEPGTFLVREKDMRAGGSFKMRPVRDDLLCKNSQSVSRS